MDKKFKDLMSNTTVDSLRFSFSHILNIGHEELLAAIEKLYHLTRIFKDGYHLKEDYSSRSIKQQWTHCIKGKTTIKITVFKSHPSKTHFEIYGISQYSTDMYPQNNLEDAYRFIAHILSMSKRGLTIKSLDIAFDVQKEFSQEINILPLQEFFNEKGKLTLFTNEVNEEEIIGIVIENSKMKLSIYNKQLKNSLVESMTRIELTQTEIKQYTKNGKRRKHTGVPVESMLDIKSYIALIISEFCKDILPVVNKTLSEPKEDEERFLVNC